MSVLLVIPLIKSYNSDKPSCLDSAQKYALNENDTQNLFRIFQAVQLLKLPYNVELKVCLYSGQLSLRCTEILIKPLKLPTI